MITDKPTHIRETAVNATAEHMIGEYDQPIDETVFADDYSMAALYRFGISEYGRCTSKVYIDTSDGTKHIGYVFVKRTKYQDSNETYLHETWLSYATLTED